MNFILNHWILSLFAFIIISATLKWFYEKYIFNIINILSEYLNQQFNGDKIIEIKEKIELVNYEYYEKIFFEKEKSVSEISIRLENDKFKLLLFNENELRKSSIYQKKYYKYKKKRKK